MALLHRFALPSGSFPNMVDATVTTALSFHRVTNILQSFISAITISDLPLSIFAIVCTEQRGHLLSMRLLRIVPVALYPR